MENLETLRASLVQKIFSTDNLNLLEAINQIFSSTEVEEKEYKLSCVEEIISQQFNASVTIIHHDWMVINFGGVEHFHEFKEITKKLPNNNKNVFPVRIVLVRA